MKNGIITKSNHTIQIRPEIRFGKPTVAGTRIAVEDILLLLQSGYRIDEIPQQYSSLTLQDTKKALQYAASILGKEEVYSIE